MLILIKMFLNNKKYPNSNNVSRKQILTNLLEKAELFNSFFFKTVFPKKQSEHSPHTYSIFD